MFSRGTALDFVVLSVVLLLPGFDRRRRGNSLLSDDGKCNRRGRTDGRTLVLSVRSFVHSRCRFVLTHTRRRRRRRGNPNVPFSAVPRRRGSPNLARRWLACLLACTWVQCVTKRRQCRRANVADCRRRRRRRRRTSARNSTLTPTLLVGERCRGNPSRTEPEMRSCAGLKRHAGELASNQPTHPNKANCPAARQRQAGQEDAAYGPARRPSLDQRVSQQHTQCSRSLSVRSRCCARRRPPRQRARTWRLFCAALCLCRVALCSVFVSPLVSLWLGRPPATPAYLWKTECLLSGDVH